MSSAGITWLSASCSKTPKHSLPPSTPTPDSSSATRTPETEAVWFDDQSDEELQQWKREQRERLQQLAAEGYVSRADVEAAAQNLR